MSIFDFNNNRAKNLANPKYGKDAINLRSTKKLLSDFTGNTHVTGDYLPLSGGTGGPYIFTGATLVDSFSATTISGGTIYSGATNLYDIFLTENDGNDITRISGGTNINTGGTANNPIINLDDDIIITSISAKTNNTLFIKLKSPFISTSPLIVPPVLSYLLLSKLLK